MSLQQARADLCAMLNQCDGCTRLKDAPPPKQNGKGSMRRAQQMCNGCENYEAIKAQMDVIVVLQKEKRKQRLRRMAR